MDEPTLLITVEKARKKRNKFSNKDQYYGI